jgi:hypothetical protein
VLLAEGEGRIGCGAGNGGWRKKEGRKKKEKDGGPAHSGTRAYDKVCGTPSRPTRSEYRTTRSWLSIGLLSGPTMEADRALVLHHACV